MRCVARKRRTFSVLTIIERQNLFTSPFRVLSINHRQRSDPYLFIYLLTYLLHLESNARRQTELSSELQPLQFVDMRSVLCITIQYYKTDVLTAAGSVDRRAGEVYAHWRGARINH
jgi:hypothetical protein